MVWSHFSSLFSACSTSRSSWSSHTCGTTIGVSAERPKNVNSKTTTKLRDWWTSTKVWILTFARVTIISDWGPAKTARSKCFWRRTIAPYVPQIIKFTIVTVKSCSEMQTAEAPTPKSSSTQTTPQFPCSFTSKLSKEVVHQDLVAIRNDSRQFPVRRRASLRESLMTHCRRIMLCQVTPQVTIWSIALCPGNKSSKRQPHSQVHQSCSLTNKRNRRTWRPTRTDYLRWTIHISMWRSKRRRKASTAIKLNWEDLIAQTAAVPYSTNERPRKAKRALLTKVRSDHLYSEWKGLNHRLKSSFLR